MPLERLDDDVAPPLVRRRFLAPEVIQTSGMDCGPATLKCLLAGFGISASYGRLREACQTSVDGTSIDTLETLAQQVGLDAEQIMIPLDHLLLAEAEALPAIVVIDRPGSGAHLVVVWRVCGDWVQVMDPAKGRLWLRRRAFLDEVYLHKADVPEEGFATWMRSSNFLRPLRYRIRELGVEPECCAGMLEAALARPGWQAIAHLDAAVRTVALLVKTGAIKRGKNSRVLLGGLLEEGPDQRAATERPQSLASSHAIVREHAAGEDGCSRVMISGAVAISVAGANALSDADRAELPRELQAALTEAPIHPDAGLIRLLGLDRVMHWAALGVLLAFVAVGRIFEAVLFRGLLDMASGSSPTWLSRNSVHSQGGVAIAAVSVFVVLMLATELALALSLRAAGGRLEVRMRRAFSRKIPRLTDRYFQSRPVSDMAERAHSVHFLRTLPAIAGQLLRALLELVGTAAALCWLHPAGAAWTLLLFAALVATQWLVYPVVNERDMRVRSHAGALAYFSLDAMLGLTSIRTHRGEENIARVSADRLAEWAASARALLRAVLGGELLQGLVGYGLAAWIVIGFLQSLDGVSSAGFGAGLLVLYWSFAMPALGQEIAVLLREFTGHRNVALRVVEPLGAPEEDVLRPAETVARTTAHARGSDRGASVLMDSVTVHAAGHSILSVDRLKIEPGEQVAIVGPSGAGKSSLVGLLLGWHRPTDGLLTVDGLPLDGFGLESLRRRTVWVDPAVYLWNRSLHYNLAYGLTAAPASLEEAIASASLIDVVNELPAGVDTLLGEAGALVSGGEGQRVRFGRGLLRERPRLVILDEPFRGLAREQRHQLLVRGLEHFRGATVLCVTHDISETLAFPRAIVVDGGRLIEDGAPRELLKRNDSHYRSLIDAETRVRELAWSGSGAVNWRRVSLSSGRIVFSDGEAE